MALGKLSSLNVCVRVSPTTGSQVTHHLTTPSAVESLSFPNQLFHILYCQEKVAFLLCNPLLPATGGCSVIPNGTFNRPLPYRLSQ